MRTYYHTSTYTKLGRKTEYILSNYMHMCLSNRTRSTLFIKGKMTQNRPTSWTSAQLSSVKLTAFSADKTCRSGTIQ